MDEKLTQTQEFYLLNYNIYIPTIIDDRILIYLNFGYAILVKEHMNCSTIYRAFSLNTYTSIGCSIYNCELLSHEIHNPFFNKVVYKYSITKAVAKKWIETNS